MLRGSQVVTDSTLGSRVQGRWAVLEAHSHLPEIQEQIREEISRGRIRVLPGPDGRIRILPVGGHTTEMRNGHLPAVLPNLAKGLQHRVHTRRAVGVRHAVGV